MQTSVSTIVFFLVATLTCVAAQHPASTVGKLQVHIQGASNPGKTTGNVYISVVAIDHNEKRTTHNTHSLPWGDRSMVEWNESFDFDEGEWNYFELIVHEDTGENLHTVSIILGTHNMKSTCGTRKCTLYYSYTFTPKYIAGNFAITIIDGSNLKNKDFSLFNKKKRRSDAYVKVTAMRIDGSSKTLETAHIWNQPNPTWNEQLDFGVCTWTSFSVQVFDKDLYKKDDALSQKRNYDLDYAYPTSEKDIDMMAYDKGSIKFHYSNKFYSNYSYIHQ